MQSLTKHIFTGVSYIALSNSLGRVASFVTLIIVTSALSLYEYGLARLALAIAGPVFTIIGLGLDQLIEADVARYLSDTKKKYAKKLIIEFYSMRTILVFLVLIAGWLFRVQLSQRYGAIITDASLVVMLYVFIQSIKTMYNTMLQTHQSFKIFALLNGLEPYVRLIFIGIAGWFWKLNVSIVLVSYVIAPVLFVLIGTPFMLRLVKFYKKTPALEQSVLWPTLKAHGKWQMILTIMGSFVDTIKIFMIKLVISVEAIAIYDVAATAYSAFANVVQLKPVLAPIIAAKSIARTKLESFLSKVSKYIILLYGSFAVVGIIISPIVVQIFFPKYIASIVLIQFLLLRLPLNFSGLTHTPALKALREQKFQTALAVLNIASIFLVAYPLIKIFGVLGMVLELLIMTVIHISIREWKMRKKFNIRTINLKAWLTWNDTDKYILDTLKKQLVRFKRNPR